MIIVNSKKQLDAKFFVNCEIKNKISDRREKSYLQKLNSSINFPFKLKA
jgi:hypothetical protein